MTRKATPETFWVKVDKSGECWVWTGSRGSGGYGKVRYQGALCFAHRLAWELTHGPIPPGMSVCHSCDNRPCCNPAHLWLGTYADNMHDRDRKGRHGRPNAKKTVCANGHPYDEKNTYHAKNRRRKCRVCGAANWRRLRAARKESAA